MLQDTRPVDIGCCPAEPSCGHKRARLVEAVPTPEPEDYRAGMKGMHPLTFEIDDVVGMSRPHRPGRLMLRLSGAEAGA